MRPAEEAELGSSSTRIGLVVPDDCHDCGPRPAGVGAGDAGRRPHAARRHAVDSRRDDALSDLRLPDQPDDHGCGRQRRQAERLRRRARVHQHHRQHLAPGRVPHHARHHARERVAHARPRQQRVQRQPGLPDQVRLRPVQPRRLDDEGLVGAARHPADALGRLRGRHLPLSLPGHGVRRAHPAADGDDVGRCGRLVPLQPAVELRRFPRRRLQRRELPASRGQRSEGASSSAARSGRSRRACRSCGAFARISSTTTTTTPAATSASA